MFSNWELVAAKSVKMSQVRPELFLLVSQYVLTRTNLDWSTLWCHKGCWNVRGFCSTVSDHLAVSLWVFFWIHAGFKKFLAAGIVETKKVSAWEAVDRGINPLLPRHVQVFFYINNQRCTTSVKNNNLKKGILWNFKCAIWILLAHLLLCSQSSGSVDQRSLCCCCSWKCCAAVHFH